MGSGLCRRENDRSQLRGSGGFSPRFPYIPPAKCFTVQPQTNILRGQSHCDKLKTKSHRIASKLFDIERAAVRVRTRETEIQILRSNTNTFHWFALEKESSP